MVAATGIIVFIKNNRPTVNNYTDRGKIYSYEKFSPD